MSLAPEISADASAERVALVVIHWLTTEQGGRQLPPSGVGDRPYTTVVQFDADPQWNTGTWSLIVTRLQMWDDGFEWLATAQFLAKEAPHPLLQADQGFGLLEGKRLVARGVVVSRAEAATLREHVDRKLLTV